MTVAPRRPRQRPGEGFCMRAAVYVVVWSSIVVALVLDDQTGERLPALAPLIAVALAITVIDLTTYRERKDR